MRKEGCEMTQESRKVQTDSLKSKIRRLQITKEGIEREIKQAWEDMAKVCGHPKARISSWSTSECMDCGYYASTKYFMDRGSALIDVDGRDIEERARG